LKNIQSTKVKTKKEVEINLNQNNHILKVYRLQLV
jgi:hypothetical protein